MASIHAPAGWYPAAHEGGEPRYWDGLQWVQQSPSTPVGPPAAFSEKRAAPHASTPRPQGWKWAAIGAGTLAVVLLVATVSLAAANNVGSPRTDALENGAGSSKAGGQVSPQAALDEREAELDAREAEISERNAASDSWATTQLNDGTFEIGVTTEQGIYQTDEVGEYCQWNIYTGDSYIDGIVDFGAGSSAPVTVTLKEGQKFSATDCGIWVRIG